MKNQKKNRTLGLVIGALIAAAYVVLTYVSSALGLAYGPVQFRLSEALTILPLFSPYSVYGLIIGCALSNLSSPLGLIDIIFGTAATAIAGVLCIKTRSLKINGFPLLSFLMPVLVNGLVVAGEIMLIAPEGEASLWLYLLNFAQIAVGEAGVLAVLGMPIYCFAKKHKIFEK